MNKTFRYLMCAAMALCMAVSLTACGGNDEPAAPEVVDELGALKSIQATFTLTLTGDYDEFFSSKSISYTDFDGSKKTEKMTGNTITITRRLDNITKQTNAKLSFDLVLENNDKDCETKTYNFTHKLLLKVVADYEKKSGVTKFDNSSIAKDRTTDFDFVAGDKELRELLHDGLQAEIAAVVSVSNGNIEASTLN